MNAEQNEAISLCKSILDNGSRNADVYWKLASALYQDGQQADANKTLIDALKLHPGNSKLLKLQEIISSTTTEHKLLEQATQLNQKSFDQGALKISCLTKSGVEGISACKRRLELTDNDSDNMRSRLLKLEEQQPPKTIATAPIEQLPQEPALPQDSVTPQDPQNASEPVAILSGTPVPTETNAADTRTVEQSAAEERKRAYKKLVTQVQAALNDLGFQTGVPDGFPGDRTRSALSIFYNVLDEPVSKSITEFTLDDLIKQKRKLEIARQLLQQSEEAYAQNNTVLAEQKLNDAKLSSKLLKVPDEFEYKLRVSQLDSPNDEAIETPVKTEQIFGEPITQDTDMPGAEPTPAIEIEIENDSAKQFVDLMNQINTLQGKIKRVEEDQARRLDQLRDVM